MRFDELGAREMVALVVLMFFGAIALSNALGGVLTMGLLIGALYMLSRLVGGQGTQTNRTNRSSRPTTYNRAPRSNYEDDYQSAPAPRRAASSAPQQVSVGEGMAYRHALDAARSAGHDPSQMQVLPVDIGTIVYRGKEQYLVRTHDVPDDADYIQPYVQLRLPQRAIGKIRFEMVDSDGQVLFIHEVNQPLDKGNNLITPPARLPVHDALATQTAWELRVLADNVLLASHKFAWDEDSPAVIRQAIADDGEISDEMREMMAANRLEKMSLDDLLGGEPDTGQQRQQGRR